MRRTGLPRSYRPGRRRLNVRSARIQPEASACPYDDTPSLRPRLPWCKLEWLVGQGDTDAVNMRLWLILTLLLAAAPGWARDHQEAKRLRRSGEIMPLEEVLRRNPQQGRRVLDVELDRRQGRYEYQVESLDRRGRVREDRYDAATGDVLPSRRRD